MPHFLSRVVFLAVLLSLVAAPQPTSATSTSSRSAADVPSDVKTFTATVTSPADIVFTYLGRDLLGGSNLRLPNGMVLIGGGQESLSCGTSSIYRYNGRGIAFVARGAVSREGIGFSLLLDGRVLLSGRPDQCATRSELEVYDPATNDVSIVSDPSTLPPVVTLLDDNQKVHISDRTIEVYAPDTQTSPSTGTLAYSHTTYTLTVLSDGRVLIADGDGTTPSEVFDPKTQTVTTVGTMTTAREYPQTTLLANGTVLITGGYVNGRTSLRTAELYEPATASFRATGSMQEIAGYHAATTTADPGKAMVAEDGVWEIYDVATGTFSVIDKTDPYYGLYSTFTVGPNAILRVSGDRMVTARANLSRYATANTFTAALTLPAPAINRRTFKVGIDAKSTDAPIVQYGLRYGPYSGPQWLPFTSNPISQTITFDTTGADKAITLFLRDANGQEVQLVTGTVDVDTRAPDTEVNPLGQWSPPTVRLTWTGQDAISPTIRYAVEVREGTDGAWMRVVSGITQTTTTYQAVDGAALFFRVRGIDEAGNVEPWPATFDTKTTVDGGAPYGGIDISFVGTNNIEVLLAAADSRSGVTDMRVGYAATFGQATWEPYARSKILSRLDAPEGCLQVAAQFRDAVGNLSPVYRQVVPNTGCPAAQTRVFLPLVRR